LKISDGSFRAHFQFKKHESVSRLPPWFHWLAIEFPSFAQRTGSQILAVEAAKRE